MTTAPIRSIRCKSPGCPEFELRYWIPKREYIPTPVFTDRDHFPKVQVDRRGWDFYKCPSKFLVSEIACNDLECTELHIQCLKLENGWRTMGEMKNSPAYVTGYEKYGGRLQHCPKGHFLRGISCSSNGFGQQWGRNTQQSSKRCRTIELNCDRVEFLG